MEKEIFDTFALESKLSGIIKSVLAESELGESNVNLRPLDIAKLITKEDGINWTQRIENALGPFYVKPYKLDKGKLDKFRNSLIAAVEVVFGEKVS